MTVKNCKREDGLVETSYWMVIMIGDKWFESDLDRYILFYWIYQSDIRGYKFGSSSYLKPERRSEHIRINDILFVSFE